MRTLVDSEIFKAITVYDYQAVCKVPEIDEKAVKSFASILITVNESIVIARRYYNITVHKAFYI